MLLLNPRNDGRSTTASTAGQSNFCLHRERRSRCARWGGSCRLDLPHRGTETDYTRGAANEAEHGGGILTLRDHAGDCVAQQDEQTDDDLCDGHISGRRSVVGNDIRRIYFWLEFPNRGMADYWPCPRSRGCFAPRASAVRDRAWLSLMRERSFRCVDAGFEVISFSDRCRPGRISPVHRCDPNGRISFRNNLGPTMELHGHGDFERSPVDWVHASWLRFAGAASN